MTDKKKHLPIHKVLTEMVRDAPARHLHTVCVAYGVEKGDIPPQPQDILGLIQAIQTAPVFPEEERLVEKTVKVLQERLAEVEKAKAEGHGGGDDE